MPIYFLQPTDGGPVKIGYSADVETRRGQLEKHYGTPLAILATIEGGRAEEQELHERFAHLRYPSERRRGKQPEQFRPAPDLMAFIGRPLLVDPNPDAVEAMPGSGFRTIGIRVSDAYAEWLTQAAKHDRVTIAGYLDRAANDRAQAIGFTTPAPERIP